MQYWLVREKELGPQPRAWPNEIDVFPFTPSSVEVLMSRLKLRWVFKRDKRNKWRWQSFAGNNVQVGASTQGYAKRKGKGGCVENAQLHGYRGEG